MSEASTGESLPDERPKPGRPRKYASAADRVRAYRERERQKREAASLAEPTTPPGPAEAATNLASAVVALRTLSATTLEQYSAVAAQITAAVDKLTDPDALEAQMNRATTELAKVKADADARIARLREQLAQATEDRDNAEAAVEAVDRELADARAAHDTRIRELETAHRDESTRAAQEHADTLRAWQERIDATAAAHAAELAEYRSTVTTQQQQLARLESELATLRDDLVHTRAAAEKEAATAAAATARLDTDLTAERARVEKLRGALEEARIAAAAAQAAETAARDRGDELRAEIVDLRGERDRLRVDLTAARAAAAESRHEADTTQTAPAES